MAIGDRGSAEAGAGLALARTLPAKSGRPTKAERESQPDRRQHILQTATRRFAEFGFQASTVRQIADDVDIKSGSLFHHFATKEEILLEIVSPAVVRLRDKAIAVADSPFDAERRLVALIEVTLTEVTGDPLCHRILNQERQVFRADKAFAEVLSARQAIYKAWLKILEDGVAAGLFRPEPDLFLTVSTIVRMLYSAADWHRDSGTVPRDYDEGSLTQFYNGFILRAVRAEGLEGAHLE